MRQLACLLVVFIAVTQASAGDENHMYNEHDFALLAFLEGRWEGRAPDGSKFYEEYSFESATVMQSRRATDASFKEFSDGSTVSLSNGEIVSAWGDFTWRANNISADSVHFMPVNAPSSFSWHRKSATEIEVVQNWTDETGKKQSYTLTLVRIGS